nr:unnamed protein product [Spirometra erinaceieuropaei]
MEAIKKKMLAMKLDKENAVDLADQLEEQLKEKETEMMKKDEEIGEISKRLTALEAEKESSESQLTETNQKLEDTEKRATEAEAEVAALQRRIRLLEDELESTDTRLTDATVKLEEASKAADESERGCKVLENRTVADEERISQLEEQLKEFTFMAEDADRKYDEASRKLAITEVDLERAESRLEASERKIVDLEEELRIVGNNMKSLEISEQEPACLSPLLPYQLFPSPVMLIRGEKYGGRTFRHLVGARHLWVAGAAVLSIHFPPVFSTSPPRTPFRTFISTYLLLKNEEEYSTDELVAEKEKYKALSEELESTFAELTGN